MDNIVNYYPISGTHLEVCVCDYDGVLCFVLVNTDTGVEKDIDEQSARAMCTIDSNTIVTDDNWDDFCTARGIFAEDN